MIPAKEGHVCRISGLQQHQQREGLQAVVASVHEVPHEYVVRVGHFAASSKELEQVVELPMNVPAHLCE